MGIEGGIEQIQAIELAENNRVQHVIDREWVVRVLRLDLFKARQRTLVIQDVETLKGLAHLGIQIQWIRIHARGCGNGATNRVLGRAAKTPVNLIKPTLDTVVLVFPSRDSVAGCDKALGNSRLRIFSLNFIK